MSFSVGSVTVLFNTLMTSKTVAMFYVGSDYLFVPSSLSQSSGNVWPGLLLFRSRHPRSTLRLYWTLLGSGKSSSEAIYKGQFYCLKKNLFQILYLEAQILPQEQIKEIFCFAAPEENDETTEAYGNVWLG